MNPIEALFQAFFAALFGPSENLPIQRAALPSRGKGRTSSSRTTPSAPSSSRSTVKVRINPARYVINYKKSEWNEGARLLKLFKDGENISYNAGREFLKGWNWPLENDPVVTLWRMPQAIYPAWYAARISGMPADPSAYQGTQIKGSKKVYVYKNGHTMSIATPKADEVIFLDPSPGRSNRIGALTGFWRMTKSGPKALTDSQAIDQANKS